MSINDSTEIRRFQVSAPTLHENRVSVSSEQRQDGKRLCFTSELIRRLVIDRNADKAEGEAMLDLRQAIAVPLTCR